MPLWTSIDADLEFDEEWDQGWHDRHDRVFPMDSEESV
jgi:hypothetical protein